MLPSLAFSRRLPLYSLLITLVVGAILIPWPKTARVWLSGETGIIELATVIFALWGAWVAALIVKDRRLLPHPLLALWFGLFTVALFFLAGEEASWGQSWFHWDTPADYAAINRQGETNLHNLSSLTEALPKTALVLAALVGGIIWPIRAWAAKTGPYLGKGWFSWIWPSALIWPAAALTVIFRVLERGLVATDMEDLIRAQYIGVRESIEFYGVLFVLAYLWDVRRRQLSQTAPGA
ncbi:MAG: hypothetical protein KA105_02430 [Caulobacter sp.]|jgi:hypothetical protein|nr:hypothetical protein [Caulobacter sp.]